MPAKQTSTRKSGVRYVAAAAGEAKEAVETVTVRSEDIKPRRRVTFKEADGTDKTTVQRAASVRMATGGLIAPVKRSRPASGSALAAKSGVLHKNDHISNVEEDEISSDDNLSGSDNSDITSEVSEGSSTVSEEKDENPCKKAKRDGTRPSYSVLRLRFLPPEFQEPQLFKFLSQFGADVINCFCVRSRRTHQSKGIAYVQFSKESVLPIVVEECHGMALGGRCLQARVVSLHRPMPSRDKVSQRRHLAYLYRTRGVTMVRHDVSHKSPIAALIKYSRTERANNAHLKRLGIDYAHNGFAEQLAKVPSHLIRNKMKKDAVRASKGDVASSSQGETVEAGEKHEGSSPIRKREKKSVTNTSRVLSTSVKSTPSAPPADSAAQGVKSGARSKTSTPQKRPEAEASPTKKSTSPSKKSSQ